MARYKPETGKIMDLKDADLALKELGLLEADLERIDAQGHKDIAAIKEATAKKGEPIRTQIQLISAALLAFSDYNKADIYKRPQVHRSDLRHHWLPPEHLHLYQEDHLGAAQETQAGPLYPG